jgi:uncharacterized protein
VIEPRSIKESQEGPDCTGPSSHSPTVSSGPTYHRRMSEAGDNIASIGERLRSDLTLAMRDRDDARTRVLRSALAAIDNAGAVEAPAGTAGTIGYSDVPRRKLDPSTIRAVLEAEISEREAGSPSTTALIGATRRRPCEQRSRLCAPTSSTTESGLNRQGLLESPLGDIGPGADQGQLP